MAEAKFIVVQQVQKAQYSSDTEMKMFEYARDVIAHIGHTSSSFIEEDIKIERVFKVTEKGIVTFYSIVFEDGRFKLEELPEVRNA